MRETARRILFRLGLTGKLLFHVGWILTLSLAVMVGVTHLRARDTIRNELRKTEIVRIERWALKNTAAIHAADRWKIAEALAELGRDPYVVYAGFFDRAGQPLAHQGDENAYVRPHRLDLLVPIRIGAAAGGLLPGGESAAPPLPGMVPDPRAAARVALQERFRRALEGTGGGGEEPRGWVEVTIATEPLDALLSGVILQLAAAAVFLLGLGTLMTWFLVRQIVEPLRILREHTTWISQGRLDEPFHEVPRPADEIGDLATHFSIMAGILKGRREELEAQIVERNRALQAARASAELEEAGGSGGISRRLGRIAHDLKTPVTGIKAFAEILLDDESLDPEDRRRFLESIRSESDRLARRLDEIGRPPEPSPGSGKAAQSGDPLFDEAMAAAAAAEAASAPPAGQDGRGTLRRVLVATADDRLRALLRDVFSGEGAEVVEACDAISALRLARETLPDGVVLDLLMEGGEALTMLGDLRQDRRTESIPVLPLSVVRDGDRFRAGAVSFQPKPLDRDRFLAAVRAALPGEREGPARVLVVDDDRFIAEAVGALLSREGMEVQIAAGGEEALLAARGDRPDLIILDLKMPGLDGVEVIRRLRAQPETIDRPVILMTAHDIPRGDQAAWPGVSLSRESFVQGVRAALHDAALR